MRDYKPEDAQALKEIHRAQGFDYEFPALDSPLFLVKKVLEVDGQVTGALFLRLSCETYLLTGGGPLEKMVAIEGLQPAALREAWEKGIDEVFCVVPPEINRRFEKRLKQMGWVESRNWPRWDRGTK